MQEQANLGECEGFLPEFPQTCRKVFCAILPTNCLPQRSWRPFFGMTSKKRTSCVFLQTLGVIFWSQTTLCAIFPGCSRILLRFCFYIITQFLHDHADSCYCRNWKLIPHPGPVLHKIFTPGPNPGPKEKRISLSESTPALRIYYHHCTQYDLQRWIQATDMLGFVAATMLPRSEPTKYRVDSTNRRITAIDIPHSTRFTLLLLSPVATGGIRWA